MRPNILGSSLGQKEDLSTDQLGNDNFAAASTLPFKLVLPTAQMCSNLHRRGYTQCFHMLSFYG